MKKILTFLILCVISVANASNSSVNSTTKHSHKKQHHHKKSHHLHKKIHRTHRAQALPVKNPAVASPDPIISAAAAQDNASAPVAATGTAVQRPKAKQPRLYSYSAYAMDGSTGEVYISKNPTEQLPIASITKLMTAMVMLDSGANLDDYVAISDADVDRLRNTYSRLKVGLELKRRDLLLLALMSSENRAAHAIARTAYPGGLSEFIKRMNRKAKSLGMTNTQFYDPTGLTVQNKSTAIDLAKMVSAAYKYKQIRADTTTKGADVMLTPRYMHHYLNSDALVRGDRLNIQVSKTGFINEAGHCLVLYSLVGNHPIAMVFLNSSGKSGRLIDAMTVTNYVSRYMNSYASAQ